VTFVLVIRSNQPGLAILMHEAAHNALFKSRALNQWGQMAVRTRFWQSLQPTAISPGPSPLYTNGQRPRFYFVIKVFDHARIAETQIPA